MRPPALALKNDNGRTRFLLVLVILVLGCALAGEAVIRQVEDRAVTVATSAAVTRVGLRADAARQLVAAGQQYLEALFDLAQDRNRLLLNGNGSHQAIEDRLARLAARRSFGVFQVALIDADGVNRWSSLGGQVHVDLSDRPHFRAHVDRNIGVHVSEPLTGRVSGQVSVQFSRRLNRPDGGFGGVIVLSVDPAVMTEDLMRLNGPTAWDIAVVRLETGQPVVRQVPADTPSLWGELQQRYPIRGGDVDVRLELRGDAYFVSRRRLDNFPLAIVVGSPAARELQDVENLHQTLLLTRLGALLALLAGAAWLIVGRSRAAVARALVVERAVAAEQARILDNMDMAVCVMRLRGAEEARVTFANRRYRKAQQALGCPPGAVIKPLSSPERAAATEELLHHGQATIERQFRNADGEMRWLRVIFTLIDRWDDELEVLEVAVDIQAEKAAAAAAISASRLATLGELSAGLAHELSQPLSVISLSAELSRMLLSRPDAARGAPDLAPVAERQQVIIDMVARAKTITDHLRMFSRQEQDEVHPVELGAVLRGAALLVEGALKDQSVELTTDIADDLPLVWGLQVLLEQVVMNLLLNARDAMREMPFDQRRVRVEARATGDQVEVRVLDNGSGIPESVQERLFEPFFTTKTVGQGTGLGLSICFGIMQTCGGSITAANRPEGGAVFTLRLKPVALQEFEEAAEHQGSN